MKSVLHWIVSNLPLALLALLLAILAWATAAEEADPITTSRFPQVVRIEEIGRPDGMVVVGKLDAWAQVTLRAPKSVLDSLSLTDFTASVNLAGLEAGIYQVPVDVAIFEGKSSCEIVSIEPSAITLELQRWTERAVPVNVQSEGEPALAYLTQAMIVTPTVVLVNGPSSYVDRVIEASADISVQDVTADVEEVLALRPVDADGQLIPYVEVEPVAAQVHVPVKLKEDYRTLTVKPVREGLIAYGYTITGFSIDPESVTVSGAPDAIAALPGFIETEPVSVEGAQSDVVAHPLLNVPSEVMLLQAQQVTVTYYVQAVQTSQTMEITMTLRGLEQTLTATVPLTSVEVIVGGPMALLETLQDGDVHGFLDLTGKSQGTYQIEPQIILPEGLNLLSINPAVVQVEILVAPTPLPTPRSPLVETPTPTPTKD